MTKLKVLDLFSGIGGFSLGLERTGGFETVAFCEIEPFCQKVLKKHWPDVPCYPDVTKLRGEDVGTVDVVCGGFPCQDISVTGRRSGLRDGTRSGLWSEIARLVGELRPRFVIVENVANLLSGPAERPGGWFGRVLADLAELGYDAEWENIPAATLGAPHRRERVWIVAYPNCTGLEGAAGERGEARERRGRDVQFPFFTGSSALSDADFSRRLRKGFQGAIADRDTWPIEPDVGRVAHGVPNRVDRLAGLGNAVVPQIPELIGRAILASSPA